MIKLTLEEFLFEVKDEILSYEELGEKKANEWEEKFMLWLKDETIKKKNIKINKGQTYYLINDESEIFDIADKYYYAVEENKEEEYWKKFQ
ncbi:MAG: hypothetical protein K2L15_01065 [Eubacteriales bacterium]|nr:hypothetical protein [Eubacteriales bacterium]